MEGHGAEKRHEGSTRQRGEHQAEPAAQECNEQALGHQLTGQPAPADAECQADGDLPPALRGPGEQQVGEVEAGDQQHQAHHRQEQRRASRGSCPESGRQHGRVDRLGHVGEHLVDLGMVAGQALAERLQVGVGRVHVEAASEASERHEHQGGPVAVVEVLHRVGTDHAVHGHRHPQLGHQAHFETAEGRWRHADHGEGKGVDADRAPDHTGVPTEALAPEAVGDDHHGMAALDLVFLRQEGPAQGGADAQNVEVVAGDHLTHRVDALAAGRDAHRAPVVGGQTGEHLVLLAQVQPVQVGDRLHLARVRDNAVDRDHAFAFVDSQGTQEELVDQGEDQRVGADAESEREQGDEGEPGFPPQGS